SGETADTLAALRHAKAQSVYTLAIVNVIGSSVAREDIRMAETVAEHAAVHINAASMFTLLMMQVHLHKYSPTKKKSPRRRKNSKTGSKKA
ncbi:MAG: SIS domain-containing protein, partial [Akkermansia sp.]|nr:SIS domain-containing protein [Akkermansia sp.]